MMPRSENPLSEKAISFSRYPTGLVARDTKPWCPALGQSRTWEAGRGILYIGYRWADVDRSEIFFFSAIACDLSPSGTDKVCAGAGLGGLAVATATIANFMTFNLYLHLSFVVR